MSEFIGPDDPILTRFVGGDSGGVHINSAIINQAYFQLVQGIPGALGLRDSERIFYRALTLHLTKNGQFLDARLAAIQSADEIFGAGSNQSQKTAKAFDTVEILASTPAPPPPTVPPVSGADSVVLVYRDGPLLLGRREAALGDPSQGSRLTATPVANERPVGFRRRVGRVLRLEPPTTAVSCPRTGRRRRHASVSPARSPRSRCPATRTRTHSSS